MKIVLSLATAAMIVASGAAVAAELPTYEVSGFPISPVQTSVLGAAHVQEQPVAAGGKAISPHQGGAPTRQARRTAAVVAR